MKDDSFRESQSKQVPTLKFTVGEISQTRIIDLVDSDRKLNLVVSDGNQHRVMPYLDDGNVRYYPALLHPTLHDAVTFPGPPAECASFSTVFEEMGGVFEKHGFSKESAFSFGLAASASWTPELFPSPPTVLICASDIYQVTIASSLLGALCRRSFLTPKLDRALPFWIQPTILVLTDYTSVREGAVWQAANIHGARVPSRRGTVESLACSKVLFTINEQSLVS